MLQHLDVSQSAGEAHLALIPKIVIEVSIGERQIFLVEGHVEQKSFSFWHLACCSPGSVAVFARISINHFVIAVASGNDDLAGIGESLGVGYDAGFGLFHVFQPDATHGPHVFLHHLAGAL